MQLSKLVFCSFLALLFYSTLFAQDTNDQPFLVLPIEGAIHGGTVALLEQTLEKAQRQSYQALIIELDTPGGLLDATREIVKLMLNSPLPIIVYVGPSGSRAGSAGTFITLAAHIAVMAPGTNIGAAHPITIAGKDPEKEGGKHLAQKIENDTLAFIETIATERGRNVEWAKKAVKESSSITEGKAFELKVIDFIARDRRDLLQKLDGRSITLGDKTTTFASTHSRIDEEEISFGLRFLNYLASPSIMFLLILVFVLGLYVEFSNPGMILPAVVSAVALILLLFASRTLPISYLGLLLIFAGVSLLIAEAYITSFGLLLLSGLGCFFFGSMMLFDAEKTDLMVPMNYIIAATASVAAVALVVGYLIVRSMKRPDVAGQEGMVGQIGTVIDVANDSGKLQLFVVSEQWSGKNITDQPLNKGDQIKVVSMEGLLLKVTPNNQEGS